MKMTFSDAAAYKVKSLIVEEENENLKLKLSIHMEHRLYSLHDMKRLLEEAGWTYLEAIGQSDDEQGVLTPLTIDSSTMWVVACA